MQKGFTTRNSTPARPQPSAENLLLDEALGLLHRFALEQTGWRGWLKRWYYSDEPLRHDAANLVRRAEVQMKHPEHTQLAGGS